MAEAVLHIGTKKTGTTFLQEFLITNQSELLAAGWTYPEFLGRRNHHDLALPFAVDRTSEIHRFLNFESEEGAKAGIANLDAKLSELVKPDERWIFSSEFMSSRLLSAGEVKAMLDLFRRHFSSIRVVVYFRRQEFMVPSTYSQSVKEGRTKGLNWNYVKSRVQDFTHLQLFNRWQAEVGPENITARPYFEAYKTDSVGMLNDFLAATGIPQREGYVMPPPSPLNANPQLTSEGLTIMRAVNARFPVSKPGERPLRPQRAAIARRIAETTAGPSFRLSAELLASMDAFFGPDNQTLVTGLGTPPEWQQWLDQSPPETTSTAKESVTNARLAEVLEGLPVADSGVAPEFIADVISRLSIPAGIVDWTDPTGHPDLSARVRPAPKSLSSGRRAMRRKLARFRTRKG